MTLELRRPYLARVPMYLLVSLLVLIPAAGSAQNFSLNFGDLLQLAATDTPGVGTWYPDRYPPCGFASQATAPDYTNNVLEQDICASNFQTPTPSFFNTQGRKYDFIANTYSVSILLYVPQSWSKKNARLAGFWATAADSTNAVGGDYPIIEFQGPITSDAGGPGPGFKYNNWVELTMTVVPGKNFVYTVTALNAPQGLSVKSPFSDSAETGLANVILEAYNYDSSYSVFWDNLDFLANSLYCK